MANTSQLLQSCVDKKYVQNIVNKTDNDCFEMLELILAEQIINNFEEMKRIIRNKRMDFLKSKIYNYHKKEKDAQLKIKEEERIQQQ